MIFPRFYAVNKNLNYVQENVGRRFKSIPEIREVKRYFKYWHLRRGIESSSPFDIQGVPINTGIK